MKKWIYLIKADGDYDTRYKIGITKKTPQQRLKQLQTGNPYKLEIVDIYQSEFADKIERTFHNIYNSNNTHGEWFELDMEQIFEFKDNCRKYEKNFEILKEQENNFII